MIRKFQDGGASVPPFVSYTPVIISDTRGGALTATSTKNTDDDSGDLTDKDLLKMLKDKLDGLPNDMDEITASLLKFYIGLQYDLFPNTSNIAVRYLQALNSILKAKFSKDSYNNAFNLISKNGGLNEVAVSERGLLFCMNQNGDFKLMSVQEFKNQSDYLPLTNSELLQMRAYRPDMIGQDGIIDIVSHGVGMDMISKFIEDRLTSMGTDELRREGYTSVEAGKISNGLLNLQEIAVLLQNQSLLQGTPITIDGLYKLEGITKNQAEQAQQALLYIYRSMPENMRALLELKAPEGSKNGALDMITSLIGSKLSVTNNLQISKVSSKDDPSAAEFDKLQMSDVMMAQAGYTAYEPVVFNNGGYYNMVLNAQKFPIMDGSKGAGAITTLDKIFETQFAGMLDSSSITMGGQEIKDIQSVKIDANNAHIVYLPYTSELGLIKPNFKMLKAMQLADKKVRELGMEVNPKDANYRNAVNSIFINFQLPVYYNEDGSINTTNYKKFAAFNADALSTAFDPDITDMDIIATSIRDPKEVKSVLNYINSSRGKDNPSNFKTPGVIKRAFNAGDHVYRGVVYMPIVTNVYNSIMSGETKITTTQAEKLQGLVDQQSRLEAQGGYHSSIGMFE